MHRETCKPRKKDTMPTNLKPRTARWLMAAGLVLGVAAANASNGFIVPHDRESLIKVGMDADAVQQTLGQPARVVTIGHQPGPTWTYDVAASWDHAVFEIEFDAAGKVARADERELLVE
jgi:hypothetical protein